MQLNNYLGDICYRLRCKAKHQTPVYINAYVNRGGKALTGKNWGDDINYWFLREIIEEPFRLLNESPIAFRCHAENYLVIGSILSFLTKPESIVWGAGAITNERALPCRPKEVLAVRGPLTRQFLMRQGISCPEIYGDPALLLNRFYPPPHTHTSI